jgi:hypothetical protein
MMFAMGAAFSPHNPYDPDTTYFHRLLDISSFYGIDLPFGIDGVLDTASTVWHQWLDNDPMTMLMTGGAAALADKPIYLDCGDNDDLGLQYQNRIFAQALGLAGLDYVYTEYAGYTGNEAGHTNLIAERLREVLKFHSQAFEAAQ